MLSEIYYTVKVWMVSLGVIYKNHENKFFPNYTNIAHVNLVKN